LKHNKFGAFCLQANNVDKAEEHLNKARELIESKYPFSNVYMNIANVYAQRKDYAKAV
jgi:Flp pilus assembly protein TadD